MSNKKYENRFVTTVPFEKKYYDKLNELLPKGVFIADEINSFVKERALELEREEKKENPPLKSPLSNITPNQAKNVVIQTTLDIFGDRRSISSYLASLEDLDKLRDLRDRGHLIESVCKTRLKKLWRRN